MGNWCSERLKKKAFAEHREHKKKLRAAELMLCFAPLCKKFAAAEPFRDPKTL
jgi:hypothetical protein